MNNIENKIILITGGARGLGYKYAEQLLAHGAKVVAIVDLITSPGQTSVATLEKEFGKGRAVFYPCDVTNAEAFEETFKKIITTFNGLDILINNAGILNDREWEKSIDVNVISLIRSSFLAMEYMNKSKGGKGGTIVNIGSVAGLTPFPPGAVYSATKSAVIMFSRGIKDLYEKTGVRVLVMCPGVTTTALFNDVGKNMSTFVDQETISKQLSSYPSQSVDIVAAAVVDLIQKGKNGAIWVSEGGQPPYAVEIPNYTKLAVPV